MQDGNPVPALDDVEVVAIFDKLHMGLEVEAVARAIWLSARPARTGQWRHAKGQDECRAMARAAIAALDRARAAAGFVTMQQDEVKRVTEDAWERGAAAWAGPD